MGAEILGLAGPLNGETCPCCKRPARTRGVCAATYIAAKRMVSRGEATWDGLEAAGRVLPAVTKRRSRLTRSVKYLLEVGMEMEVEADK